MTTVQDFVDQLEEEVVPFRHAVLESPFLRQLRDGTLSREHYARVLVEIFHYTKHTPRLLAAAASRLGPEHQGLADRFLANAREEAGHDRWALSDLRALGRDTEPVVRSAPLANTEALVAYSYYVINYIDPRGLLGSNYALESLGSGVASEVAERVKEVLGVGDGAVTFLAGHGKADQHHVVTLKKITTDFATTSAVRSLVVRTAKAVYKLYAAMLAEVWQEVQAGRTHGALLVPGER